MARVVCSGGADRLARVSATAVNPPSAPIKSRSPASCQTSVAIAESALSAAKPKTVRRRRGRPPIRSASRPHTGDATTALSGPRPIRTPDQMATAWGSVTPRWRTNNGKNGPENENPTNATKRTASKAARFTCQTDTDRPRNARCAVQSMRGACGPSSRGIASPRERPWCWSFYHGVRGPQCRGTGKHHTLLHKWLQVFNRLRVFR
jgi:hypothetical protein